MWRLYEVFMFGICNKIIKINKNLTEKINASLLRYSHQKNLQSKYVNPVIASHRGRCHTSKTPFIFDLGPVVQKLQPILLRKLLGFLVIRPR